MIHVMMGHIVYNTWYFLQIVFTCNKFQVASCGVFRIINPFQEMAQYASKKLVHGREGLDIVILGQRENRLNIRRIFSILQYYLFLSFAFFITAIAASLSAAILSLADIISFFASTTPVCPAT